MNSSFKSFDVTQIVGSKNPIATPIAYDTTAIVMAITRSFSPNQTVANFAGQLTKNGYPIAAKICPIIQM